MKLSSVLVSSTTQSDGGTTASSRRPDGGGGGAGGGAGEVAKRGVGKSSACGVVRGLTGCGWRSLPRDTPRCRALEKRKVVLLTCVAYFKRGLTTFEVYSSLRTATSFQPVVPDRASAEQLFGGLNLGGGSPFAAFTI